MLDTDDIHHPDSFAHPDWKHAWLHAQSGWGAFGIWEQARWAPLSKAERVAFAIRVGGWPDHLGWVTRREFGRVQINPHLNIHAYSNDPELPREMQMPRVAIGETPF